VSAIGVFIVDKGNRSIKQFDHDGSFIHALTMSSYVTSISIAKNDELFVAISGDSSCDIQVIFYLRCSVTLFFFCSIGVSVAHSQKKTHWLGLGTNVMAISFILKEFSERKKCSNFARKISHNAILFFLASM
jgi:hypothetical protein